MGLRILSSFQVGYKSSPAERQPRLDLLKARNGSIRAANRDLVEKRNVAAPPQHCVFKTINHLESIRAPRYRRLPVNLDGFKIPSGRPRFFRFWNI